MNQKEKQELDAYITGYHREEKNVHIPPNVELTCPVCDTAFITKKALVEGERLTCPNCDAKLVVIDDDLEEEEEDIFADEEEEEEVDDEKEEEEEEKVNTLDDDEQDDYDDRRVPKIDKDYS